MPDCRFHIHIIRDYIAPTFQAIDLAAELREFAVRSAPFSCISVAEKNLAIRIATHRYREFPGRIRVTSGLVVVILFYRRYTRLFSNFAAAC